MPLLTLKNLSVRFGAGPNAFRAVDALDLCVEAGEIVGLVGESGSGKSVAMLALLGLLGRDARVSADALTFDGRDLTALAERERRRLLGRDIAMVFQDPAGSLDPSYTVGYQLKEVLRRHLGLSGAELEARALALLERVEIPDPKSRLSAYPHQLSGGMSQRVAIAMAIACGPRLLIADEPTTALDVTIQAQIVDLLVSLQREEGMALLMITHDIALIARLAARVAVMYAGQLVDLGRAPGLFVHPVHPYTEALRLAMPGAGAERLSALPGVVPGPLDRPAGCLFAPRCPYARPRCHAERPPLEATPNGATRCFFPLVETDPCPHPDKEPR